MHHTTLAVALLAAVTMQAPPIFRSARELVVLPVTITDRSGQLVSGLPAERFSVYDNDRRQPVVFFSNEDVPVSVALVVDDSGSMGRKLGEVLAASLHFSRSSHPEDELFLIEFNDDVRDALGGRSLSAQDAGQLEAALRSLVPRGRTALYDGLMAGLDRLDSGALSRKILVLISDGGDNASTVDLNAVLARARASSVTIYTLGVFDPEDRDANPGVLQSLASTTGGERFLPRSAGPLMQACDQIAREIRSSYTVGFEPPERDGHYHRVVVKVDGADRGTLTTRTRPGYVASASAEPRR